MDFVDLIAHALNFAAPAAMLALLLPLAGRLLLKKTGFIQLWWVQFAIQFIACVLVLLTGLWFFGHDGRLATYAAMVLVAATAQALMGRTR